MHRHIPSTQPFLPQMRAIEQYTCHYWSLGKCISFFPCSRYSQMSGSVSKLNYWGFLNSVLWLNDHLCKHWDTLLSVSFVISKSEIPVPSVSLPSYLTVSTWRLVSWADILRHLSQICLWSQACLKPMMDWWSVQAPASGLLHAGRSHSKHWKIDIW